MLINRISKDHFFFLNTFVLIVILIIGCGGGSENGNGNGDGNGNGEPVISTGSISGMVTSSDGSPLNAVHVRAVNLSNNIQLSAFSGIGSTVNAKLLNTGTNSKLIVQNGLYLIEGLPAGTYRVLIEKMDSRSLVFDPDRYSPFVIMNNPIVSFPDEYYNGANESSTDDPLESVVVIVNDGQTTQSINFIANVSTCPAGQKDCQDDCIPEASTCCGDGTSCSANFPICTDLPDFCCPAAFPFSCGDGAFCADDPNLSGCPISTETCVGFCGQSADGCFCDSECVTFGDCCPDFQQVCGPLPTPIPSPTPTPCAPDEKPCPFSGICIPENATICSATSNSCISCTLAEFPVCCTDPSAPIGFSCAANISLCP